MSLGTDFSTVKINDSTIELKPLESIDNQSGPTEDSKLIQAAIKINVTVPPTISDLDGPKQKAKYVATILLGCAFGGVLRDFISVCVFGKIMEDTFSVSVPLTACCCVIAIPFALYGSGRFDE